MEVIVKNQEINSVSRWCVFLCGAGCGGGCAIGCMGDTPGIPIADVIASLRVSYFSYNLAQRF